LWGTPSLAGRRVGIAGVGKVGHYLVEHVLDDGGSVVVSDVSEAAIARVVTARPQVDVADVDALVDQEMDVYAPCALGGALNDDTVPRLRAKVVCGAANNQLDHPGIEKMVADRGILYAPDYVVNSGGLIQVADEIEGFSEPRRAARRPRSSRPPRRCSHWPRTRASRPRSPLTGWRSGAWPTSADSAPSGCHESEDPATAQRSADRRTAEVSQMLRVDGR
jgi:hypothetical protein